MKNYSDKILNRKDKREKFNQDFPPFITHPNKVSLIRSRVNESNERRER